MRPREPGDGVGVLDLLAAGGDDRARLADRVETEVAPSDARLLAPIVSPGAQRNVRVDAAAILGLEG
jgi:hypothetical protein